MIAFKQSSSKLSLSAIWDLIYVQTYQPDEDIWTSVIAGYLKSYLARKQDSAIRFRHSKLPEPSRCRSIRRRRMDIASDISAWDQKLSHRRNNAIVLIVGSDYRGLPHVLVAGNTELPRIRKVIGRVDVGELSVRLGSRPLAIAVSLSEKLYRAPKIAARSKIRFREVVELLRFRVIRISPDPPVA